MLVVRRMSPPIGNFQNFEQWLWALTLNRYAYYAWVILWINRLFSILQDFDKSVRVEYCQQCLTKIGQRQKQKRTDQNKTEHAQTEHAQTEHQVQDAGLHFFYNQTELQAQDFIFNSVFFFFQTWVRSFLVPLILWRPRCHLQSLLLTFVFVFIY